MQEYDCKNNITYFNLFDNDKKWAPNFNIYGKPRSSNVRSHASNLFSLFDERND